jgi:hypothetical protein
MAKKKTTKTTPESQPTEPRQQTATEAAVPTPDILANVRKGDQLRIEDRDGSTATFACTMTVTKVAKDKVYCRSKAINKRNCLQTLVHACDTSVNVN